MTDFSVMIIGGGIGGLALAHGLRRAGIPTSVYERTHHRNDWLQGYRIHINPAGAAALRACLPPAGWQAFLDTVSPGGGFGFLTDRCTELLAMTDVEINPSSDAPENRHYAVSRIRLRDTLLAGLEDILHPGKTFTRYDVAGNRVIAHFADGTTATADLLIGADGANSRVRRQLLPHAHRIDTGAVAIAGKYELTPEREKTLPAALATRANLVVPRSRGSLFTAVWKQSHQPTDRPLNDLTDYVLWGFTDAADRFPPDLQDLDGRALQRTVIERIPGWSPAFHRLIAESDPDTVNAFNVKSATPVNPWPSGRVTLLGDAIHNMTPMAGIGANTALRDADLLRRTLMAVHAGEMPLIPAISKYEREMIDYGFAAVKKSLRNARSAAQSTRATRTALRVMLRLAAATPPLHRAMARQLGN
ncbi:FAD-dependent oxidoreductase [Micromonospora viridifaciens]|nr:NAD(P)/FAD-dependent oxidoreductase [Micromonospora viridifaciens]